MGNLDYTDHSIIKGQRGQRALLPQRKKKSITEIKRPGYSTLAWENQGVGENLYEDKEGRVWSKRVKFKFIAKAVCQVVKGPVKPSALEGTRFCRKEQRNQIDQKGERREGHSDDSAQPSWYVVGDSAFWEKCHAGRK